MPKSWEQKLILKKKTVVITLPKTNIAPTNGWLEYYFPIGEAYFQGQAVSFREGTPCFDKNLDLSVGSR